ncbi:MAG: hypothetical protein VYC34_00055, partial [Planctomycetota bacterium]|nr:hypothetical protein [Planctomycetota bacterium]
PMRIALATCANLPDWEVDDAPLHEALRRRGVDLHQPAWDDPRFEWAACDAVLIRTTWDYMERCDEYVAWADRVAARTRLYNPPAVVRWNTHKRYLRELEERGIRTAPTVWLDRGGRADVAGLMRDRGWRRGFIKPAIGATARETLRFAADGEGLAAAQAHVDRLLPREDLMLQPYLETVETAGEVSAIFIDEEVTHCVRKVPVPGDYRVQDDFDAHDEPTTFSGSDLERARAAVGAAESILNVNLLYARADFLRDPASGDLLLTELEMVEPSLFFRHGPDAADRLAEALLRRIETESHPASAP